MSYQGHNVTLYHNKSFLSSLCVCVCVEPDDETLLVGGNLQFLVQSLKEMLQSIQGYRSHCPKFLLMREHSSLGGRS